MPLAEEALFWLPTAAVAAVALLAFIVAVAQPPRRAKAFWMVATLVLGGAAVAVTLWHQAQRQDEGRARAARIEGRLRELGRHIDAVGQQLTAAGAQGSADNFGSFDAALDTLNAKLDALGPRIEALREKARNREIDPQTAAKLTEYLRQFGTNRVVVSCVPNDVEAFGYATQIAGVLRGAGWEALGPEETKIFGEAQGMEITLYVKAGVKPAESARILLDAFSRFNIPHKSGIAASDAIPDPATVELFVGHKG